MKKVFSFFFSLVILLSVAPTKTYATATDDSTSYSASKKITVVGLGFVGLANAVLLAQHNEVYALDIVKEKVDMVNHKISPFVDSEISYYLKNKDLNLTATTDESLAYKNADYIVVATPTDYDVEKNSFDTSTVEKVISRSIELNPKATIVIKSTIPIGYTQKIREKFNSKNIIFSPEFLREGKALYDNLYPSRIIVGCELSNESSKNTALDFAQLLKNGSNKKSVSVLLTDFTEAESIKLFSNSYLAMRVAYFNELDTYCEINDMNAKQVIDGVCADERIGSHYNNPSFGYGGYCLPKDTKQLLANFKGIPNNIIQSIVSANETRKDFISNSISKKQPKTVGIYKLAMKSGSDNFRQSAIIDVMKKISDKGIKVVVYDPSLKSDKFLDYAIIKDFDEFAKASDVIVANRYETQLNSVEDKLFTRDVYFRD